MKKKNIVCAVVSNAAILLLIGILVWVCAPFPAAVATSGPVYGGGKTSGSVSLLFNVYERADNVEKILSVLERNRVSATFFIGGVWAEKNVGTLKKIAENNELGNHGYLHLDHKTLSEKRNEEEILLCHRLIEAHTGVSPTLFAPPSGSYGDATLAVCAQHGYTVIMWTKDTIDWRDKDVDLITKRATSGLQSGDFILMHPTDATVEALPTILSKIREANLAVVPVGEALTTSSVV